MQSLDWYWNDDKYLGLKGTEWKKMLIFLSLSNLMICNIHLLDSKHSTILQPTILYIN